MAADMEVGTQAGTSLTPLTTEAIMEIMSATNLVGLQRAQSDSVTLRIRISVLLRIRFGWIASSLAKISGSSCRPRRLRTGLNPDLTKVALKTENCEVVKQVNYIQRRK
jgi:hypothetical protein